MCSNESSKADVDNYKFAAQAKIDQMQKFMAYF